MKKVFFIWMAVLLGTAACAEKRVTTADSTALKKRISYFFTLGMGPMIGCNQCQRTGKVASFAASTVHGVRIGKRLFLGAGIGFDSYENWKTLPLFGSASWDLFGKKNKVSVQLDYGYSFAWINNAAKEYGYKRDRGGEIFNPSLGYRINYGAARLSFSIGYKFQRVFSYYEYPIYNSFLPVYGPNTRETRTDMNRIVLAMTVGW